MCSLLINLNSEHLLALRVSAGTLGLQFAGNVLLLAMDSF